MSEAEAIAVRDRYLPVGSPFRRELERLGGKRRG
jgi:hypothetical protein